MPGMSARQYLPLDLNDWRWNDRARLGTKHDLKSFWHTLRSDLDEKDVARMEVMSTFAQQPLRMLSWSVLRLQERKAEEALESMLHQDLFQEDPSGRVCGLVPRHENHSKEPFKLVLVMI